MAGTRQYLILLAMAGIAGAASSAYGAWLQLPPDSSALVYGNAWRGLLLLSALAVVLYYRELERLATLDHLTGCANRRHFYSMAEAELARSRRHDRPMGLVILDADHFKKINDRWGHAAGDAMLRALTDKLRGELRQVDVLGRIGGEEFALLLPETPRHESLSIAERLRQRLADLRVGS